MVKDRFLLIKALKLRGHEKISPTNFPDPSKVANSRKRKLDSSFKDYQAVKENVSHLTELEAEEAVSEPPCRSRGVSDEDHEALKELFRRAEDILLPERRLVSISTLQQPVQGDEVL